MLAAFSRTQPQAVCGSRSPCAPSSWGFGHSMIPPAPSSRRLNHEHGTLDKGNQPMANALGGCLPGPNADPVTFACGSSRVFLTNRELAPSPIRPSCMKTSPLRTAFVRTLCVLALAPAPLAAMSREFEGSRTNSILLNGPWEFARGDGNENAESAAGQAKFSWQTVKLPRPFMKWSQEAASQTKIVWARRTFNVTAATSSTTRACG